MPAGRGQPSVHEHDDAVGEALDLVQHVRADDDRAALAPEAPEQVDEGDALHGVGAVERFVEHEHPRLDDQRGGDLDPLAHALAEAVDAAVGDVEQADGRQRGVGCVAVADPAQVGAVAHELAGGQPGRDGLVLGDEGQVAVDAAVAPRVAAVDADVTLVDADRAGHRPHQRRLAGAVRAEQPGDAGPERAAQLGQRDLGAEPHRDVVDRRPSARRRTPGRPRPGPDGVGTRHRSTQR